MGKSFSLWYMTNRMSNWFETHDNFVSWSIAFIMAYRPSHADVINFSVTLCFLHIVSIIDTARSMPASSLL